MLIFLYGPDTLNSRRQLKKMTAKFKADRDPQGLNVVILDCIQKTTEQIWNEILASPFLAEKRLIVLENLLVSKHLKLIADLKDQIENKKIPDSNTLLFWEATGEFKNKEAEMLSELLKKEKYSQLFGLLKGVKLTAWINQEIRDRKGKISQTALNYLAQNTNGDIWRLNSLINQLVAYKETAEIGINDINQFVLEKADDNIFNLAEAIALKQSKQIFQMIREQYKKGEDPGYLFAMILRQFRILLELRDLYEHEDRLTSDQIAKKLGLHPFVVKKSLPIIKRYTLTELKNIYQQLLDIDIKTKTGVESQSLLLDLFVGKICAGA